MNNIQKDFLILGCFTRSFDESHIKNNRIHLISSIFFCRDFPKDDAEMYRRFHNQKITSDSEKMFVIVVEKGNITFKPKVNNNSEKVVTVSISIDFLIKNIFFHPAEPERKKESNVKADDDIMEKFFGGSDLLHKDFTLLGTNCFFIFKGLSWSSILLIFKINGIDISGGTSPKRHLLSTVDGLLREFLNVFFDYDSKVINKKIYDSFADKHNILSSNIPLDFYAKFTKDISVVLPQLTINDLKLIPSILEDLPLIEKNNYESNKEMNEFILNNFIFTIKSLREGIINKLNEKKQRLIQKLNKLESDLINSNYELRKIEEIFELSTSSNSNKEKKKIKKERVKLRENPKIKKNIQININKLNKNIKDLQIEISQNDKEEINIVNKLNDSSIKELNNKYNNLCVSSSRNLSKYKIF